MVPHQISEVSPACSIKKNKHHYHQQQQHNPQQDATLENVEVDDDSAFSSLTLGSSSSCSLSLWTTIIPYGDLDDENPFSWENLCLGQDEDQQEEKVDQEDMQGMNGKELSLIHSLDGIPFDAEKKPECPEEEIRDTIHAKRSPWIRNGQQQQECEHNKDKDSCNHINKTEFGPQGGSAMVGKKGVAVKRTKTTRVKKNKKKPKRPLTAYNLFFKAKRPELVQRGLSFERIGQTIGKAWKCLPQEKRQEYKWWAKKDLIRYRRQLALWRTMQRLVLGGGVIRDYKDSEDNKGTHQNKAKKPQRRGANGDVVSPVSLSSCRSQKQKEECAVVLVSPKQQHLQSPRTIFNDLVPPPPPTGLTGLADRQRLQAERKGEEEEERSVGWCQKSLDHRPEAAATPHSWPPPVTPVVLPKIPCGRDQYNYPTLFPLSCYEHGAKPVVSDSILSSGCTTMRMPQQHQSLCGYDDSAVLPNAQFPLAGSTLCSSYYPGWNAYPPPEMAAPGGPHPPLAFLVDPQQQQKYYPHPPGYCFSPPFQLSFTCVRMKESQVKDYMDNLRCEVHLQPWISPLLRDCCLSSNACSRKSPRNKEQQGVS